MQSLDIVLASVRGARRSPRRPCRAGKGPRVDGEPSPGDRSSRSPRRSPTDEGGRTQAGKEQPMEHSALGTQRRQATPRSAHAPRDLRRLVGRAFRRDIRHRREAPSFALVHPRHVLDLRSLNSARRRHFYSTMLPNRIRCISLITNDRDTFYSTKNRRGPAHLLPRRMPPPPAKKGVKPCQVFCSVSHSKRRIGTQNKCQQNEVSSVARWYIFVVYI